MEYLDTEMKGIDFRQRTLILSTIFENLLVKVEFLPFDVKQVVLARMLEGKFLEILNKNILTNKVLHRFKYSHK